MVGIRDDVPVRDAFFSRRPRPLNAIRDMYTFQAAIRSELLLRKGVPDCIAPAPHPRPKAVSPSLRVRDVTRKRDHLDYRSVFLTLLPKNGKADPFRRVRTKLARASLPPIATWRD